MFFSRFADKVNCKWPFIDFLKKFLIERSSTRITYFTILKWFFFNIQNTYCFIQLEDLIWVLFYSLRMNFFNHSKIFITEKIWILRRKKRYISTFKSILEQCWRKGADDTYCWDFDLFPLFSYSTWVSNLSQPSWNHLSPRLKSLLVGLRRWKMEERKIVFGHMLIQLWLWYNGTSNQRPMCHFTSKPTTMMMSMPSSSSSSITVKWKWKEKNINNRWIYNRRIQN